MDSAGHSHLLRDIRNPVFGPAAGKARGRVSAESRAAVLALNSSAGYLGLALGSTAAGIAAVYGDFGQPAAAIILLAMAGMPFLASLRDKVPRSFHSD